MGIFLDNGCLETLCTIILITWALYKWLTKHYNYWAARGVPYDEPRFPFGSLKEVLLGRTSRCHGHDSLYRRFPDNAYYGIIDFRKPSLVVKDPDLVKQILVKDFKHFEDRPPISTNPQEYIARSLFSLGGEEWNVLRAKLTPTFTSGKLKAMFVLMDRCCEALRTQLERELKIKDVLDVADLMSKFSLEMIASCAFGIDANCIAEQNPRLLQILNLTTKYPIIKRLLRLISPSLFALLNLNVFPSEMAEFIKNLVRDNVEYRKKHGVTRNDFLDLLMNIKQNRDLDKSKDSANEMSSSSTFGIPDGGLTFEQMAAQTLLFFTAGFESSSSIMAFCLYELSCNKNVQDKLYRELKKAVEQNQGKISYELMTNATFLEQVINETMRMYGAGQTLTRVCTKRYQLPGSSLVVERGTGVIVPLYSIHHDPLYYSEPETFRPERFSAEEAQKRTPFTFLPWGEGPRNCIAMRFAMMSVKLGLATLILSYHVDLSAQQKVPIEINKKSFLLKPAEPVLLKFSRRQD